MAWIFPELVLGGSVPGTCLYFHPLRNLWFLQRLPAFGSTDRILVLRELPASEEWQQVLHPLKVSFGFRWGKGASSEALQIHCQLLIIERSIKGKMEVSGMTCLSLRPPLHDTCCVAWLSYSPGLQNTKSDLLSRSLLIGWVNKWKHLEQSLGHLKDSIYTNYYYHYQLTSGRGLGGAFPTAAHEHGVGTRGFSTAFLSSPSLVLGQQATESPLYLRVTQLVHRISARSPGNFSLPSFQNCSVA